MTWQMACHALTNRATESLGSSRNEAVHNTLVLFSDASTEGDKKGLMNNWYWKGT